MASIVNFGKSGLGVRKISDHVCVRAAVTASEQITVPTGAKHVLLSGTGPFSVAFGTNPTAAAPADSDDGSANEIINPATPDESRLFDVSGVAKIAVAAGTSCAVSAAFFN